MTADQVFKLVFAALLIALLAIRYYYGIQRRRRGETAWRATPEAVAREGKLWLMLRPLAAMYLVGFTIWYLAHPPGGWADAPLPGWLRWLGANLAAAGLPLLAWVHATLGRHWSTTMQLREEHTLVIGGPYRWVRHPMYTTLWMGFIGLGLVSAFYPLLGLLVLIAPLFARIVVREERMLVEHFGEDYQAYMTRTGRFLPRINRDAK